MDIEVAAQVSTFRSKRSPKPSTTPLGIPCFSQQRLPRSGGALNSSLRLLIDECAAAQPLLQLLKRAGHDIVTSVDVLGIDASDEAVFALAKREDRVTLTRDCADFLTIIESNGDYPGLLLVYGDGDSRDMTYTEITASIDHITRVFKDGIAGRPIILNHYRLP